MMKPVVGMAVLALLLSACSEEPGSRGWCEDQAERDKGQWTGEDAITFAKHCVFEGSNIGSKSWCEALDDKPKSDWSTNEATAYTQYCVL